jgi:uncharacterized lipoprotein YddW (UPF0748 family)
MTMLERITITLFVSCALVGCGPTVGPAGFDAEARACWMDQVVHTNWDSAMAALSAAGFNMILPSMLSSGSAYYPSEYVPMIGGEDELARCIEAAHSHGIEVHVWKVNWALWRVREDSLAKYVREGRIQVSFDGKRVPQVSRELGWNQRYDWLCPAHPENRELEKNLMMELVRKYDVDGVHFDYMRFPYEPLCYCETCRKKFTEETRLVLDHWPDDVWKGGRYREIYLDWRRELITSSAREIAAAIHDYDPYVCVSLAARSGLEHAYNSDAQVWWEWIDEGILDFVCPMNYAEDPAGYVESIREHFPLIGGRIPYYGGIGLFRMRDAGLLIEAIEGGRALGQDGFVVFSYEWGGLQSMLDTVTGFLTNSEHTLLPHRAPKVGFYLRGAASHTEEGFPVYSVDSAITAEVVVMLQAKLREGITRIYGDLSIQDVNREVVEHVQSVNLRQCERIPCSFRPGRKGRYRLMLSGTMELSNGQERPFVTKSFPFEVR